MLSENEIVQIREHLDKAQNPLFYYDNDIDGLCSFLLLRRYIKRGKGVVVKSYPDLNVQYAKRAKELNADYIFILDKPLISKEFIEEIKKYNLPVVWIDHHDIEGQINAEKEEIYLYNPAKKKGKEKSFEPTTYLCYSVSKKKEDIWIALMGCIADHFMPDFVFEFIKEYPEYWSKNKEIKDPFEALYTTEIGKLAQSLGYGLKDSISNVVLFQNFLISCKSPNDIMQEEDHNINFRKKYVQIKRKYDEILKEAIKEYNDKLLFFEYSGDLSISAEISNELCFRYPDKMIVVVYVKGGICNISLRGKGIKDILEKAIAGLSGASGGGHDEAAGARISKNDLEKFKEALIKEINYKVL